MTNVLSTQPTYDCGADNNALDDGITKSEQASRTTSAYFTWFPLRRTSLRRL